MDRRLSKLRQSCDQVIIPTLFDINDFGLTVRAIKEIEPFAKKITVVLNQARKDDVPVFMDTFGPLGHSLGRIRKSAAMQDMLLEKRSIASLAGSGGGSKAIIIRQFLEILPGSLRGWGYQRLKQSRLKESDSKKPCEARMNTNRKKSKFSASQVLEDQPTQAEGLLVPTRREGAKGGRPPLKLIE